VREVLIIQDTLSHLKSDEVRQDFLAGTNCATKINADDMNLLEKFFIEVTPTRPLRSDQPSFVTSAHNAADVFSNVIDAKPKEFLTATYTHVRDVLQTIQGCGYFDKDIVTVEKVAEEEQKEEGGDDMESETLSEQGSSGLNDCGDNDEQQQKMGGTDEGIPEVIANNHREQTPIEVQKVITNVNTQMVITNHTPKDFVGELPIKCAPSAKNVPVPMFKCPPTQQQMIINQQHSIPQQLISVPAAIAPNMVANLAPGIVPQPIGVTTTPNPHIAPTTVRAVEQAYFKQHQYIHQQPPQQMRPQQQPPIHEVIGSANFFFLQESELDSPEAPTPAPGFPSQHIQQQPTIKQTQPSPSLTHNHNNPQQPPLPTVTNIHHHNSSPIPLQQQQPLQPPPHLQQLQQNSGNPGIPTQTYTNQTFSNVAPQQQQQHPQQKQPQQQMFTPPGLNVNGINNSATVSTII
jgi:caprin-1